MKPIRTGKIPLAAVAALALLSLALTGCYYYEESYYPSYRSYGHGYSHGYGYGHGYGHYAPTHHYHGGYGGYGRYGGGYCY